MKCEDCKYWVKDIELSQKHQIQWYGFCHRYPRKEEKYESDWCGEYKKKCLNRTKNA